MTPTPRYAGWGYFLLYWGSMFLVVGLAWLATWGLYFLTKGWW